MPAVRTITITVNGPDGLRFLTSLVTRRSRYRLDVPPALCRLVESGRRSIDVTPRDAEHVADFVDELVAAGWIDDAVPPVVFSPRPGEGVTIVREVLAERIRASGDGDPPTARVWIALAAGTRGVLVDWERDGNRRLAAIELDEGRRHRMTVLVSEPNIALARVWARR